MAGQCIPVAPPSPHHTPLLGRCSLNFLYIYCLFFFTSCITDLLQSGGADPLPSLLVGGGGGGGNESEEKCMVVSLAYTSCAGTTIVAPQSDC